MNFLRNLFYIFFIICNFSFSQQWITTEITNFATIDFPLNSERNEVQNQVIFHVTDDSASYNVSLRKLNKQQNNQVQQEFYENVLKGTLDAANAELISQTNVYTNGLQGLEFKYLVSKNSAAPGLRYKRVFYANQHIINIGFIPLLDINENLEQKKQHFFNSFALKLDKVEEQQNSSTHSNNSNDQSFKIGYLIGQALVFLIIIGVLVGIVFLIRFLTRKKQIKTTTSQNPKPQKPDLICIQCEGKNRLNSKYCNRCGYELNK